MNSRQSLLRATLGAIVGLSLLAGCDSVEVHNEVPPSNPGPDIDFPGYDFEVHASFSYEVAVALHARIRLAGINGAVEIRGSAGATSVKISGKRRVGSSKSLADAEQHLDDLEVRVDDLTDEVLIETVQPQHSEGRQYVVDYTITLPENLDVWVESTNGRVSLADLFASASVRLINGPIDGDVALPLNGVLDLSTSNGNIDLAIPTSTSADFSAKVAIGSINMTNLQAEDLARSSRSLTCKLGAGEGTIDLSTVNGTITVTGR
jgi:hypothetical protein